MNKDKQIEEMAKVMHERAHEIAEDPYGIAKLLAQNKRMPDDFAETLYKAGYRKASDVAREIFEKIEKIAMHGTTPFGLCLMSMGEVAFAKLKKKYIGEDTNVLTNAEDGE